LTLRPIIPNAQAGVNHVCFAIEKFDPNEVMGILTDNGLEPIEFGISCPGQTIDVCNKIASMGQ